MEYIDGSALLSLKVQIHRGRATGKTISKASAQSLEPGPDGRLDSP